MFKSSSATYGLSDLGQRFSLCKMRMGLKKVIVIVTTMQHALNENVSFSIFYMFEYLSHWINSYTFFVSPAVPDIG